MFKTLRGGHFLPILALNMVEVLLFWSLNFYSERSFFSVLSNLGSKQELAVDLNIYSSLSASVRIGFVVKLSRISLDSSVGFIYCILPSLPCFILLADILAFQSSC